MKAALTSILLTLLVLGGCGFKNINSTLLCDDWFSSENFRTSLTIQIDNNNHKVYLKETTENLDYSAEKNRQLIEAELYDLTESQYEFDEWTRNFKEVGDEITWSEKYATWTLNRITLDLIIKSKEGRKRKESSHYCEKLEI
jgi:hypothetical protein